jgi:lysozyme
MPRAARLPRASAAAFLVAVMLVAAPPGARAATARAPGVDVSIWQGTIDWAAAAGSGRAEFAIMRADKGDTYVDPTYGTNLAGADANGVVAGAYHRATPSATPGDALAEADHFLAVARNAAGDVIPALDIEETGGLSPAELRDWVRTWVVRVERKLGVRPMLYASPNFWRVRMGDTTWFADNGYPLWIAHWDVSSPDVPAGDWGGNGWTFWQWTSTGHVAGIDTDVDRDRFVSADLLHGRIASITVTPAAGGMVTGPRIRCGGTAVRCSRLANPDDVVTLTATPDPDAVLLGWTGACAAAGTSATCDVTALGDVTASAVFGYPASVTVSGTGAGTVASSPAGIACDPTCTADFVAGSTLTLTATPDSASGFGSWSGACAGSSPDCVLTVDGPVSVDARFDAAVWLEEDGAGTAYAWARVKDVRALGGSYLREHLAGASVAFAFDGSSVTLFAVEGRSMGKASVSVDGTVVGTFDGFARSFGSGVAHRFTGLGSGPHTLLVTALGKGRPAATDTWVGVDALRWGGATRKDPRPIEAAWGPVTAAGASGGAFVRSDVAGVVARLGFTGTGVTLITVRGPSMGRTQLWVDGELVRTIDLYAPARTYGVERTVSGLSDAAHTIRVVVLGTHRAASGGSTVAVDGWIVR